jgi:DeoR/GlpR family transcriptional regulator of sugar metabolism
MVDAGRCADDRLRIDDESIRHALAARDLHLTVVTNCLPVARALGTNAQVSRDLCPGDYVPRRAGTSAPSGSSSSAGSRRTRRSSALAGSRRTA